MPSASGLGRDADWRAAARSAIEAARLPHCDLAVVFASPHFRDDYAAILEFVRTELAPGLLVGCSGQGIIGTAAEVEGAPAVSVLSLALPGANLRHLNLRQEDIYSANTPAAWYRRTGLAPDEVNGWLVLADPFSFESEALLPALEAAYPGVPVIGGLASADPSSRATSLFLNGQVLDSGAILVALGGAWAFQSVVSQGAEPIGQTWTITAVEQNVIRELGGRKPLDVLAETVRNQPPAVQQRASRNILVGLAMDEYRDDYHRGDFLIRNLVGVDQATGALAVAARPRVGQTLQFQLRDAAAADDELRVMLSTASASLGTVAPAAALLYSCNGRGAGLFGAPDHDAAALDSEFAGLPVAGFFCNGEIGPVGGKAFVHGFTASIAFIVPRR